LKRGTKEKEQERFYLRSTAEGRETLERLRWKGPEGEKKPARRKEPKK